MSPRLLALLRHVKRQDPDCSWEAIAKQALGEIYHPDMSMTDVIHHLVAAYEEALAEPRFEIGRGRSAMEDLVLSPIKGIHSIELAGPRNRETKYSVGEFYDAIILTILGQLSITRIDWCREELGQEWANPQEQPA